MPGIAGVILTFGIAVDANVIIYERIREEIMSGGQKVKAAVRIGYSKGLSAIIDGNITNLIVCLVLGSVGTPEIRGFAITLGIGVVTTLISGLLITRVIYTVLLEGGVMKRVPMLPSVVPALHRLLEPNIDWIGKRFIFYIVSGVLLSGSLTVMAIQGANMFDNEFRGGTAVTFELSEGKTLTRQDVENRLRERAGREPVGSEVNRLLTAQVIAINPLADNVTSSTFKIKTIVTNRDAVEATVLEAFSDVLDARPPLQFASVLTRPILQGALGENIDRPDVRDNADAFIGGVAVVVSGINPPVSLDELNARLNATRPPRPLVHARPAPRARSSEGTPASVSAVAMLATDEERRYY